MVAMMVMGGFDFEDEMEMEKGRAVCKISVERAGLKPRGVNRRRPLASPFSHSPPQCGA
jgi:hypothetical protein